jgi:hypothetical protein
MKKKYDPETCITAKELRDAGIPIPDAIPDEGWIPSGTMRMVATQVKQDIKDPTLLRFTASVEFFSPFIFARPKDLD